MERIHDNAANIVRLLLEDDPIVRVCSQCEKEHGIQPHHSAGQRRSHSLCKRHTVEALRAVDTPEEEIEEIVRGVDMRGGWPPDLGPVNTVGQL